MVRRWRILSLRQASRNASDTYGEPLSVMTRAMGTPCWRKRATAASRNATAVLPNSLVATLARATREASSIATCT